MAERVCLVTGANSGFGRAVATELAAEDARVVMVCGDTRRGEAARASVVSATGSERVELLVADLGDPTAVRGVAASVRRRHRRVDVLVAAASTWAPSGEAPERVLAVNTLGPFLLVHELLDLLRASAPARVLLLASRARVPFEPDERGDWRPARAFDASMSANALLVGELGLRLVGTGVTVLGFDPALRSEAVLQGAPGLLRWSRRALRRTPDRAAAAALAVLDDPALAARGGAVISGSRVIGPSPDTAPARRVWAWAARRSGVDASPVHATVEA